MTCLICVTWLVEMCHVTHWFVCRDSWIYVTLLVDVCWYLWNDKTHDILSNYHVCAFMAPKRKCLCIHDMICWCVRRDSLMCVPGLVDMCDITHWYHTLKPITCALSWRKKGNVCVFMHVWYASPHMSQWRVRHLIDMCDTPLDICDMTRWYVWRVMIHNTTLKTVTFAL